MREESVYLGQIDTEPRGHRIAETNDLAISRPGAQRRRIKVSGDDLPLGGSRLDTVQISACSRGHDLPHFLGNAFRTPVGRVPIFLDLRRQRAGSAVLEAGIDDSTEPSGHRPGEATPFKGRVAIGILRIEKVTIFNEP